MSRRVDIEDYEDAVKVSLLYSLYGYEDHVKNQEARIAAERQRIQDSERTIAKIHQEVKDDYKYIRQLKAALDKLGYEYGTD